MDPVCGLLDKLNIKFESTKKFFTIFLEIFIEMLG